MSWLAAVRTRLQLVFARRATRARAEDETAFHIEMETDRLIREQQLSHPEAHRRALASFGGVTRHRETLHEGHGLAWLGGFSLDMLLGFRMLKKYPGLTLVGGLAMAFAIWVGTVVFHVMGFLVHPSLPLPEGDRIVQVANWNTEEDNDDPRAGREFLAWRTTLTSVTTLGAYRDAALTLITSDGDGRAVAGAEITATAFRIAPTPPLHGRVILPADEEAAAPAVAVLGYDVWRTRFASDPGVVGRSVRLGETSATVIGVMPEGFAFPVAHELWTQLRPDLLEQAPRTGAAITIFGKLAPGVTLEAAQAELATLGRRAAAEYPEAYQHILPRVAPYAEGISPVSGNDLAMMSSIYFFVLVLLVLVCSNVALLIFARAASREGELVVRSALGASRGRIVMQLFAEALVLGGAAAAVGLAAAHVVLGGWTMQFLKVNMGPVPFWYDQGISPLTFAAAIGLTVLGAVIAGVMPALKITRGLGARMKEGTAGSSVKFGGVWTAVIVAQVAVTVAFPSIVAIEQRELRRVKSFDIGFKADEYLGMDIDLDVVVPPGADSAAVIAAHRVRYGAALEEIRRRLAAQPGIAGVTFVDQLPRMYHPGGLVEVDGISAPGELPEVNYTAADPSYFSVLKAPILAGRGFDAGDLSPDARVVIVDERFIDQLMHGRNPIGARMRFVGRPNKDGTPAEVQPWLEIVGVVRELGMSSVWDNDIMPGAYFPSGLARAGTMSMMVHAPGDPLAVGPRIREIAAAVDPALRLVDMQRMDRIADPFLWIIRLWLRVSLLLTAIAVLLSLAGIYAVLSFTVARRTREIGVRIALGASRPKLIAAIFRRPLTHVVIGVVAGGVLIFLGAVAASNGDGGLGRVEGGLSVGNVALLLAYVAFMLGVCLLACVVPTWRALRVEPTEALRAE